MRLIDEASKAWRMFSVQAMSMAAGIQGAWLYLPDDLRAAVDPRVVHGITIALLVLGVIGRVVKQDKVSGS